MKILLAILIIFLTIIFLLLTYSVKIIYEIKLVNFDFSAKLTVKFPFSKEVYNSKNLKKKTQATRKEKNNKSGKKIDINTIKQLKDPAYSVISEICRIIKKRCRIIELDTKAKVALDDPMENGVAFGIISGVLNVISLVLKEKCRVKRINLEVQSDFYSSEGLIFESCGTLRISPVIFITTVLFNKKLIKDIKRILDILKREENENG